MSSKWLRGLQILNHIQGKERGGAALAALTQCTEVETFSDVPFKPELGDLPLTAREARKEAPLHLSNIIIVIFSPW